MAVSDTAEYHELTLEVSEDNGTTWSKICGLTTFNVNRNSSVTSSKVPDGCSDETKPYIVKKGVESKEMKISGAGFWSRQSHPIMMTWWHSGATKLVRVGNQNAAPGSVQYEKGLCLCTTLDVDKGDKGAMVTAKIELEFADEIELILAA